MRRAGLRITRSRRFGLAPMVLFHDALHRVARGLRRWKPRAKGASVAGARPSRFAALHAQIANWLRYRGGRLLPDVGPATLLVLAERAP